jgi:hypothetical protein
VQKPTSKAVVLIACSSVITAGSTVSAQPSLHPLQQVAIVSYEDSPLSIASARVLSTSKPAAVAFAVANVTNRVIDDYDVRVYVYRANGRPTGSKSTRQRPTIQPGTDHADLVSLGELMAIEPGGVVLVAITAVTFEDGSCGEYRSLTRWIASRQRLHA